MNILCCLYGRLNFVLWNGKCCLYIAVYGLYKPIIYATQNVQMHLKNQLSLAQIHKFHFLLLCFLTQVLVQMVPVFGMFYFYFYPYHILLVVLS